MNALEARGEEAGANVGTVASCLVPTSITQPTLGGTSSWRVLMEPAWCSALYCLELPKIIFESLPFSPSPTFPDGNDSRGRLMAASYRQREEEAIEREMGILPREKVEVFVRCFRHI